jgi:hypothetical protein
LPGEPTPLDRNGSLASFRVEQGAGDPPLVIVIKRGGQFIHFVAIREGRGSTKLKSKLFEQEGNMEFVLLDPTTEDPVPRVQINVTFTLETEIINELNAHFSANCTLEKNE